VITSLPALSLIRGGPFPVAALWEVDCIGMGAGGYPSLGSGAPETGPSCMAAWFPAFSCGGSAQVCQRQARRRGYAGAGWAEMAPGYRNSQSYPGMACSYPRTPGSYPVAWAGTLAQVEAILARVEAVLAPAYPGMTVGIQEWEVGIREWANGFRRGSFQYPNPAFQPPAPPNASRGF